MKFRTTILFALLFLAASCENDNEGTVWDDPTYVRISVVPESLVDQDEKSVNQKWFEADSIRLFDVKNWGLTIKTNNFTDGPGMAEVFFSRGWSAEAPMYAVRPASETTVCSETGAERVDVAPDQILSTSFYPGTVPSMGRVTGNRTAYKAEMKNLTGALSFAMIDSTVSSVTITSLGGEPLAGEIDVDFTKLENNEDGFWTLSENGKSSSEIVLTPVKDAKARWEHDTFRKGTYYANVLAQTYSKGLKMVARFHDGRQVEQTLEGGAEGVSVPRSGIVLSPKAMDETLPDEFEMKISFEKWPFKEAIVPEADQQNTNGVLGDKYTFVYEYQNGSTFTNDFDFYIYGRDDIYRYEPGNKLVYLKNGNARFALPAVYGRYLKSVKVEVNNGQTYPKPFQIMSFDWKTSVKSAGAYKGSPAVINFPAEGMRTEKNTSYYLQATSGGTSVTAITLVYSTTLD